MINALLIINIILIFPFQVPLREIWNKKAQSNLVNFSLIVDLESVVVFNTLPASLVQGQLLQHSKEIWHKLESVNKNKMHFSCHSDWYS